MRMLLAAMAAFFLIQAVMPAKAACPPGTRYDCEQVGNKQSCGCR